MSNAWRSQRPLLLPDHPRLSCSRRAASSPFCAATSNVHRNQKKKAVPWCSSQFQAGTRRDGWPLGRNTHCAGKRRGAPPSRGVSRPGVRGVGAKGVRQLGPLSRRKPGAKVCQWDSKVTRTHADGLQRRLTAQPCEISCEARVPVTGAGQGGGERAAGAQARIVAAAERRSNASTAQGLARAASFPLPSSAMHSNLLGGREGKRSGAPALPSRRQRWLLGLTEAARSSRNSSCRTGGEEPAAAKLFNKAGPRALPRCGRCGCCSRLAEKQCREGSGANDPSDSSSSGHCEAATWRSRLAASTAPAAVPWAQVGLCRRGGCRMRHLPRGWPLRAGRALAARASSTATETTA